jgi:hypothetical protein
MNRLFAAAALAPMFLVSGAFAQDAPEEAKKQLWCGTAMVAFFSAMPSDQLSPEEQKEAAGYIAGGKALIETGAQGYLAAGFTQEAIDKLKLELETGVMDEINADKAQYSFEECLPLLPQEDASSASSEASSEATDPSASSAM